MLCSWGLNIRLEELEKELIVVLSKHVSVWESGQFPHFPAAAIFMGEVNCHTAGNRGRVSYLTVNIYMKGKGCLRMYVH